MKLLIVDDEPILRQGIVNKVRRSGLPLDIVGEAGDGITGLELVRREAPDIVITDIRMPVMDGIEFIEQSLLMNEQLIFIVVSGYSDFEYAKQALRLGVFDYLLKPVEDDQLKECLSKIINKIEKGRMSKDEMIRLRNETDLSRETLRKQYMTKMIQQSDQLNISSVERDEQLCLLENKYHHYLAVVLVCEPIQLPHYSFRPGDENLIWFAIENVISERLESTGRDGILFQHSLREHEMVILLGIESLNESLVVQDWLQEVRYGLQNYLKLQVTIAMGTIVDQIGQMPLSYRQAKLALRNQMIHGTGQIYDYESLQKQSVERGFLLTDEDESKLVYWLNDYNATALQSWIELRIQSLAQSSSATYMQLEWLCVDLYLLFRKYLLANTSETEWIIGEMDDLLQWLQKLSAWQDAVNQMQRIAANIVGYLSQNHPVSNKDLMGEVKLYIETHFASTITLQSISERFYIHPNYFSRRFKEKHGQTFVDYLTAIRMKKAMDWIRETDLQVQQIANKVGFEDASYFTSVFRKFYGLTPKQYREQIQTKP